MTSENQNRKIDEKDKKEKKKRVGGIAALSLLISLFDKLGEIIYNAVINGFFGRIFTSYTKLSEKLSHGFFSRIFTRNGKTKKFFRRIRKFLARNLDSSFSMSFATSGIKKLCSLPLQYYGNFGLFFGVYSIVVYCIRRFVPGMSIPAESHLYTGILLVVASFPMLFSRISIAYSVRNSVIGRAIFKHACGYTDETFENKKASSQRGGNFMLFMGLLAGLSTFFINPLLILIFILTAVVLTLIATSPEIGVLLTVAVIPFLSFFQSPSIILALLVLITTFFYVIKLIRGKRIFKLEIIDFAVLVFGILIMLSSMFSAGGEESFNAALLSTVLILGYFLLVNLMRTEKWIKRCVIALVSSASITVLIGVFEFVFGGESDKWLDPSFFSLIKTRVVSLFENPNVLATFLVMIFPFIIALTVISKNRNEKFLTRTFCLLFVLCIIFTWSRAAWIAAILGALVFAILYSKKSFRIFGVLAITLPIIPMILPTSIIERFLSISNLADSSIAYRIYTWKGTLNTLKDYLFTGIGYGDSAFEAVYPSYAYSGIEAAPHSHSLMLQIILGMGLIGFIVFALVIFFNFQKCFEYVKNTEKSESKIYVIAAVTSIISALVMGVFDYIWYNQRIFYLFWIILAIGCAFVRVGDYERNRRSEIDPY